MIPNNEKKKHHRHHEPGTEHKRRKHSKKNADSTNPQSTIINDSTDNTATPSKLYQDGHDQNFNPYQKNTHKYSFEEMRELVERNFYEESVLPIEGAKRIFVQSLGSHIKAFVDEIESKKMRFNSDLQHQEPPSYMQNNMNRGGKQNMKKPNSFTDEDNIDDDSVSKDDLYKFIRNEKEQKNKAQYNILSDSDVNKFEMNSPNINENSTGSSNHISRLNKDNLFNDIGGSESGEMPASTKKPSNYRVRSDFDDNNEQQDYSPLDDFYINPQNQQNPTKQQNPKQQQNSTKQQNPTKQQKPQSNNNNNNSNNNTNNTKNTNTNTNSNRINNNVINNNNNNNNFNDNDDMITEEEEEDGEMINNGGVGGANDDDDGWSNDSASRKTAPSQGGQDILPKRRTITGFNEFTLDDNDPDGFYGII